MGGKGRGQKLSSTIGKTAGHQVSASRPAAEDLPLTGLAIRRPHTHTHTHTHNCSKQGWI
eukprot:637332-Pelagomonas_calceolata.AAC.1